MNVAVRNRDSRFISTIFCCWTGPYASGCAQSAAYLACVLLCRWHASSSFCCCFCCHKHAVLSIYETPQEAIEIFEEMHETGVLPGLMTYNTLIAGCVRAEHPNEALSVFKLMQERNIKRDQVKLAVYRRDNIVDLIHSLEGNKTRPVVFVATVCLDR